MSSKTSPAIERAAHAVRDDQVAHLPEIKSLVERLGKARSAHTAAVATVTDLERQVADFRTMSGPREGEIQELEQVQIDVAIGCALGDAQAENAWIDAEVAMARAQRYMRQHAVALPQFERWAQESRPNVPALAAEVNRLEVDLAESRYAAKLEVAHAKLSA